MSSVMNSAHIHLHVCLVRNEQPSFEDALQAALANRACVTWDLIEPSMAAQAFSREQIDRCDVLLLVLADSYGQLSPSGISFLHLNYIYAATKRKPMIALIKYADDAHLFSRQRLELAALIEKEQGAAVIGMLANNQATIAQLNTKIDDLMSANLASHSPELLDKPTMSYSLDAASINGLGIVSATNLANHAKSNQNPSPKPAQEPTTVPSLNLDDMVTVSYTAHAYQDGNLQEISATHRFSWVQIVILLKELPSPFSSEQMLRRLNESLKSVALLEAAKILPNVHAVARCQLVAADFDWLKNQMLAQGWLIKDPQPRNGRELLSINPNI